MLVYNNAPRPKFAGSINDHRLALTLWEVSRGIMVIRSIYGPNNAYAMITRPHQISPSIAEARANLEPIERDEYSAEWLAYYGE